MARIFTDPATGGYHSPGHPEAPFRVLKTAERLKAAGHGLELPDVRALERDALLVHAPGHLAALRSGAYSDPDTPHHPGIEAIAFTSLAGALSAAAAALSGQPAFSLMRPPGHHAGRERIAGFCYLSNLAAAVVKSLAGKKTVRVAILDVDVHHGDGTQELVQGREDVLFCSLHQTPLYPGTGLSSEGNCLNFPLAPGTAEGPYLERLEEALGKIADFKPGLLAVSAGFDTYKDCPIAGLRLEEGTYRRIGRLAAQAAPRRFAVLEGGYAEALPRLVEGFLEGFF